MFFRVIKNKSKILKNRANKNNMAEYVANLVNTINSVRYGNFIARLEKHPDKGLNNVTQCFNRMIETLNDREEMIIEYQNELRRRNEFQEIIINSLSDGLLVLDKNLKIITITQNIPKWFGEHKKIKGKEIQKFVNVLKGKDFKELNEEEISIIDNENSFSATVKTFEAEEYQNNYLMIIKDITKQKEVETLKEDFVATLTHDLKVPIIAESNMLEFLLSERFGSLNDKQQEAIKNMQNSNKELLDLVHIVLDTYRIKENGIKLHKENLSLTKFLKEIAEEMQPIADVSKNKIICDFKSEFEYELDSLQFKRVMKNLIQNAILYGEANTNIEIKLYKKDKYIYITVKDYGKGIAKEDIEKIFNKYYSANKKFRKIGTGLGLYLAKEIVTAHNGKLYVKSEENKFTEFCIKLPIASV